ncbi:G-protein-signaling modulator 2-like [Styela clava]
MLEDDNFFDLITRLQGRRMEDQRCEMRDDQYELSAVLRPNPPDPLQIITPRRMGQWGGDENSLEMMGVSLLPQFFFKLLRVVNPWGNSNQWTYLKGGNSQHQQISTMMNMLANSQSKRMDEQRVSLSGLPGLRVNGEGVINLQQPDGAAAPLPVVLRPRLENGGIP